LRVIRRSGSSDNLDGGMKRLSARAKSLQISHRIPPVNDVYKWNLPYGLDIWTPQKKVMNIEWDDEGNVELVSLHRGAWELELIALAKSVETRLPALARSLFDALPANAIPC
jgi:hypothetical protein